jgi:hypothetical protein
VYIYVVNIGIVAFPPEPLKGAYKMVKVNKSGGNVKEKRKKDERLRKLKS